MSSDEEQEEKTTQNPDTASNGDSQALKTYININTHTRNIVVCYLQFYLALDSKGWPPLLPQEGFCMSGHQRS